MGGKIVRLSVNYEINWAVSKNGKILFIFRLPHFDSNLLNPAQSYNFFWTSWNYITTAGKI